MMSQPNAMKDIFKKNHVRQNVRGLHCVLAWDDKLSHWKVTDSGSVTSECIRIRLLWKGHINMAGLCLEAEGKIQI